MSLPRTLYRWGAVFTVIAVLIASVTPIVQAGDPTATWSLTVHVVDTNSNPRQNVSVMVYASGSPDPIKIVTTNAEGKAIFSGLEAGTYLLQARDVSGQLAGYSSIDIGPDKNNVVNLTLDDADHRGITGTIIGSKAIVTVQPDEEPSLFWSVEVEDGGTFSIGLPSTIAEYTLSVVYDNTILTSDFVIPDSEDILSLPPIYTASNDTTCSSINVDLQVQEQLSEVGYEVRELHLIPVTLEEDSDCLPVEARSILNNIKWQPVDIPEVGPIAITALVPGTYIMRVVLENQLQQWSDVQIVEVNSGENQWTHLLPENLIEITGSVSVNGEVAPNTPISIFKYIEQNNRWYQVGELPNIETDGDGRFSSYVPDGNLQICYKPELCGPIGDVNTSRDVGVINFIDTGEGDDLPAGDKILEVHLVQGDGSPSLDGEVSLYLEAEDGSYVNIASGGRADSDGWIQFNDIPSGEYLIVVNVQDRLFARAKILLNESEERLQLIVDDKIDEGEIGVTGDIRLGPADYAWIYVEPVDPDAGEHIEWQIWSSDGHYSVVVPEGEYIITVDYWVAGNDGEDTWIGSFGGEIAIGGRSDLPPLDVFNESCLTMNGSISGAESTGYQYSNYEEKYKELRARGVWLVDLIRVDFLESIQSTTVETGCDILLEEFERPFWAAPVIDGDWSISGLPAGRYVVKMDPYQLDENGEFSRSYVYFDDVTVDGSISGLTFALSEPAIVRGRIVKNAVKQGGIGLSICPAFDWPWVWTQQAVTNDDGEFTFLTMPGRFYIVNDTGDDPCSREAITGEFEAAWFGTVDLGDVAIDSTNHDSTGGGGTPETGSGGAEPGEPIPGGNNSGDISVLMPDDLVEVISQPGGEVSLEVPANGTVAIPSSSVQELVAAGKDAVRFDYGAVEVSLPVANLDLSRLATVNPDLGTVAGKSDVQLRFTVKEAEPASLPAGYTAAGGLYEINLEAVAPDAEPVAVNKLPEPVEITVPVIWTGNPMLVGLWYQQDDGSLVPVPSWPAGDGALTAALRHFSRYVVAARQPSFTDVKGHWAQRDVEAAYAHGIANGFDAATFAPDRPVKRIEFVAMLTRALGLEPDASAAQRFEDLTPAWEGVAGAAYQAGLVRGVSASRFEPNRQLNRLELAVMIGRALKAHGFSLTEEQVSNVLAQFKDGAAVPAWAREAVALAVDAGVVRGVRRDELVLNRTATRAETATIAVRFLEAWLREDEE